MPVERKEVESLSSLVDAVLELYKEPADPAFLWFRGLSCASYELLPKLMRDTKPVDDVFERELRLLTRFRQRSMATSQRDISRTTGSTYLLCSTMDCQLAFWNGVKIFSSRLTLR